MNYRMMICFTAIIIYSCNSEEVATATEQNKTDAAIVDSLPKADKMPVLAENIKINTRNTSPGDVVNFAKKFIGVPYKYGSTDPSQGFDCSGFITHVFNHFKIEVPRSSVDFTHVGSEVDPSLSKAGDLILFTGTDTLETPVGHMGIVTENTDSLRFIHSTSGKKYGVTITALNEYYLKRFVKVIRVF